MASHSDDKPETRTASTILPLPLHDRLRARAAERRWTISRELRQMVEDTLERDAA